jgi:hypothetical protein
MSFSHALVCALRSAFNISYTRAVHAVWTIVCYHFITRIEKDTHVLMADLIVSSSEMFQAPKKSNIVQGSVTNNNGFWIGWLDLSTPLQL